MPNSGNCERANDKYEINIMR